MPAMHLDSVVAGPSATLMRLARRLHDSGSTFAMCVTVACCKIYFAVIVRPVGGANCDAARLMMSIS
jgi:hypothetical protein